MRKITALLVVAFFVGVAIPVFNTQSKMVTTSEINTVSSETFLPPSPMPEPNGYQGQF